MATAPGRIAGFSMSTFTLVLPLLLVAAGCGAVKRQPPPARPIAGSPAARPNVLFIAVDDLRPMLGRYGHPAIRTPNLDRLADQGTMFQRAYCNVPVCGASRASLLTGLRPTPSRFMGYDTWAERDAPGALSLPAHFKKNGYHTVSLGKVFHFRDDMKGSWSQEPWRATYRLPNGERGEGRHYLDPSNQLLETMAGTRGAAYEMADVADSAYADGQMTQRAVALLKELSRADSPFFLALGYSKPHLPFNAPKRYWDLYPPEGIQRADNPHWPAHAPREGWYGTGELRNYSGVPKDGPIPDGLARDLIRGYQACVSYVDALIGEVLRTLQRTGLADHTIVVLWGDHGYLLGEHKLWCKHITFNKALHVPLLISGPGLPAGQRVGGLVEYVDLYPTLCELAGLEKPGHLAGSSLVPLIHDPRRPGKEQILSRYMNMEAIKTDQFLYTEWVDGTGQVLDRMLFDHREDPDENSNVAEKAAYAAVVRDLHRRLEDERR